MYKKKGSLTRLVASCVETAFYNTLPKGSRKEGHLSLEGVEEDVSSYLVTLRKREDIGA